MTPYEIMLSESQERMVFVVHPEDVDELMDVFEKFELPHAVIGKVTDTETMLVTTGRRSYSRRTYWTSVQIHQL